MHHITLWVASECCYWLCDDFDFIVSWFNQNNMYLCSLW